MSILRESPKPVVDDLPMKPLEITVPFAEGGYLLSEAAEEAVAEIVTSEQFKMGGLIVLRGHTDSVGNDRANLKASERRAQAVADALEEQGASSENIEIIGIGEMRPIAPNAKLDGTPHEEGRAKNRRVDVTIEPPELEDDPVPESSDPAAGPTPSPT
ncbi:hypothetical protein AB433_07045 [Croceicoccus naphthovorans]|uniref:OmpA-like domain-containing protein n=1 Tax=Croceicoccus naphthovorans TaxID=1348774 RepID=A0A0G3XLW8_9SPHN|nr:hypothetical protein AB433_07045 [Croceicoccus naphthovorans]